MQERFPGPPREAHPFFHQAGKYSSQRNRSSLRELVIAPHEVIVYGIRDRAAQEVDVPRHLHAPPVGRDGLETRYFLFEVFHHVPERGICVEAPGICAKELPLHFQEALGQRFVTPRCFSSHLSSERCRFLHRLPAPVESASWSDTARSFYLSESGSARTIVPCRAALVRYARQVETSREKPPPVDRYPFRINSAGKSFHLEVLEQTALPRMPARPTPDGRAPTQITTAPKEY